MSPPPTAPGPATPLPAQWPREHPASAPVDGMLAELHALASAHHASPSWRVWLDQVFAHTVTRTGDRPRLQLALLELGARPRPGALQWVFPYSGIPTPEMASCLESLVAAMLRAGCDPNTTYDPGGGLPVTPILLDAAFLFDDDLAVRMCTLLLDAGASPDGPAPDPAGVALRQRRHALPLSVALARPTPAVTELLVGRGASPERLGADDWERASKAVRAWHRARGLSAALPGLEKATPRAPPARM